nr:Crp/Fnr family transcriptional regulator [Methylomarinum sp. Ch1-1]MDP4520211.1 Crp/Fnr family transcriptional regulator [Methylomarinum sp. Ch1-1]
MQQTNEAMDDCGWPIVEFSNSFEQSKPKQLSAKQVLYQQGDRVDRVYRIQRGMVKLFSYLSNGRARIVRLHNENHWLGLEGLVGRSYEHTAVAVGDLTVACISMNRLQLLERDDPRQYCQILKQGYQYLAQADRWIADFSTGGIKPRVARLVDFLAKLEHGESSNMVELLTVHEMADMLGVTPESVSRILAEFKRNHTLHKLETQSYQSYQIDCKLLQYEARQ